jgi:hypothetical protein
VLSVADNAVTAASLAEKLAGVLAAEPLARAVIAIEYTLV